MPDASMPDAARIHFDDLADYVREPALRTLFAAGLLKIVNGLRPLPGDFRWEGPNLYGIFWAAHRIDADNFSSVDRRWHENDAVPLEAVDDRKIWAFLISQAMDAGISIDEVVSSAPEQITLWLDSYRWPAPKGPVPEELLP